MIRLDMRTRVLLSTPMSNCHFGKALANVTELLDEENTCPELYQAIRKWLDADLCSSEWISARNHLLALLDSATKGPITSIRPDCSVALLTARSSGIHSPDGWKDGLFAKMKDELSSGYCSPPEMVQCGSCGIPIMSSVGYELDSGARVCSTKCLSKVTP